MPTLQNFASAKFSELFVISVIFNIYPSGNFKGRNTLKKNNHTFENQIVEIESCV